MRKYIVITNIWGKKYNIYGSLVDTFREEREYFATMAQVNEYVALFEAICADYKIPESVKDGKETLYMPKRDGERVWGYVIGDTENNSILRFGGIKMYNINKNSPKLRVKDYIFRQPDEIPHGYKWDEGEYEGWLQYRWGDGKNAVGYIEKERSKPKKEKHEDFEEIETDYIDEIENMYAKLSDRERILLKQDRW